jgi:PHP family Zn ribbon phosphoesterase
MLKWHKADLHVHTVLSPCGELLMGPRNIIQRAREIGLDIIAITDHNASENVPGVMAAAKNTGITIIPGMEITTQEEAHFIGLFPDLTALASFQTMVYAHLPEGENNPDFFGPQYIVNEKNEVLGENSRLLIFGTTLTTKKVVQLVTELNGLAYPAHVDRKSYSLLNQLGFVPVDLKLTALEISWNGSVAEVMEKFPDAFEYPFVTSSDAHETAQLGRGFTEFYIEAPTLTEIKLALAGEQGRRFRIQQNIKYS